MGLLFNQIRLIVIVALLAFLGKFLHSLATQHNQSTVQKIISKVFGGGDTGKQGVRPQTDRKHDYTYINW